MTDLTYNFSLHRSGDGRVFDLGSGTLEFGKKLVAGLEAEWSKWERENFPGDVKEVIAALEGSDVHASPVDDKGPAFHLADDWEIL